MIKFTYTIYIRSNLQKQFVDQYQKKYWGKSF